MLVLNSSYPGEKLGNWPKVAKPTSETCRILPMCCLLLESELLITALLPPNVTTDAESIRINRILSSHIFSDNF